MVTTCLIVLIFGLHHYWVKLCMLQFLRVVFLCYLVALPVLSCTLLLSSVIFPTVYAWYQLKYYTTTPSTAAGYPITLLIMFYSKIIVKNVANKIRQLYTQKWHRKVHYCVSWILIKRYFQWIIRHGTISMFPKSMSWVSRHNLDIHTAICTIHHSLWPYFTKVHQSSFLVQDKFSQVEMDLQSSQLCSLSSSSTKPSQKYHFKLALP